jgi:hypothetical protein
MPFKSGLSGRAFGEGVFENDAALRAVTYLDELAGVDKLEPTTSVTGEKITYSLYAKQCSTAEAAEQVRNHLDSGVLHKLAAKMVANFFLPRAVSDYTCERYVPVILGACAMNHGCHTLYSAAGYYPYFPTYKNMLIGIFEAAKLMDTAKEQMKKALDGPDGFEPGNAIDFTYFARPLNYSPSNNKDPYAKIMTGGMPAGYIPEYQQAISGIVVFGLCLKSEKQRANDLKMCGPCNMTRGMVFSCGRCRAKVYCSKTCQRKDLRRHKPVCRTAEDEATMRERYSAWQNTIYIRLRSPASTPVMSSMNLRQQSPHAHGRPVDVQVDFVRRKTRFCGLFARSWVFAETQDVSFRIYARGWSNTTVFSP